MFCRKCGAQIPDDSMFCAKCGAKVEAVNNNTANNVNYQNYNVEQQIPNTEVQESANGSEPQNSGIDKKFMLGGLAFVILGFIFFRGILFYNTLLCVLMLILTSIGIKAFKSKEYAKVAVCVVVGIGLELGISALKDMHKQEVREMVRNGGAKTSSSILPSFSFGKKGISVDDIKNIDFRKENTIEVYSLGEDIFWLLKDRTIKINDDKYSVAMRVVHNRKKTSVGIFDVDLKKNTMKITGMCEYDDKRVCLKAENIKDGREDKIPENSPFANIVAYLKSGKTDITKPVIDRNIVDLDNYRWGMSREDAMRVNYELKQVGDGKDTKFEPFLSVSPRNMYVGGQKIDNIILSFKSNKLNSITFYLHENGNQHYYDNQDVEENRSFNRILNNWKRMTYYFTDHLGPAVKRESLYPNNHKISTKSKEDYVSQGNTYYWWTSQAKITVSAYKTAFDDSYSHMYIVSISSKD